MSDAQITTERKRWPTWTKILSATIGVPVALLAILIGVAIASRYALDYKNEPLCHKQLFIMLMNWHGIEKKQAFPNVDGKSNDSINELSPFAGEDIDFWKEKYQYLPGLRDDDPGDLVIAYFKKPTRYLWHGNPQSIFRDARWQVVPLDFEGAGFGKGARDRAIPYSGENCERLTLQEFKIRLGKTLLFLKDNDRPHWQTVVAENEEFLKALEAD